MAARRVGGLGRRCFLTLHCSACSFFFQTSDAIKLILTQQQHILRKKEETRFLAGASGDAVHLESVGASNDPPGKRPSSSSSSSSSAGGTREKGVAPRVSAAAASSAAAKFSLLPLADASLLLKRRGALVLRSLHGDPLVGSRRQRGEFAPQAPTAEMAKMLNKSCVPCPRCKREGRWEEGKK
ncbi:UNVERIFIED_CONTAM: hypothetical protein HHA_227310 [Hammondia hammondi]|eukprot:XP_008882096.1 hypothetical protein HHA_227310 [Hammondia hammondi]